MIAVAEEDLVMPPNKKALHSSKTYGFDCGFSCCFRQWRAESHCRFLHGYALSFEFVFAAEELDTRGWVVDFGGLKNLRAILEQTFDHKLLVAADDPWKDILRGLAQPHHGDVMSRPGMELPAADVIVVPATGCEAFARMVYELATAWLKDAGFAPRCRLVSVRVAEHGANGAICFG